MSALLRCFMACLPPPPTTAGPSWLQEHNAKVIQTAVSSADPPRRKARHAISLYAIAQTCMKFVVGGLLTRSQHEASEERSAEAERLRVRALNRARTQGTNVTVAHGQPFELVESTVIDEATRAPLTHEKVERGTTRLETLHFIVHAPLHNLRRRTVTSMNLGFMWQPVADVTLDMGSHEPREAANGEPLIMQFEMPRAVIPTTPFAKGRYLCNIWYTADNHPDTLRHERDIEVRIH